MKKKIIGLFITASMTCTMLPCMPVHAGSTTTSEIKLGDYVELGTYNGAKILWRCVDVDDTNGPLMLSDRVLCFKEFDAAGTNATGSHSRESSDRGLYGSNYWADSNIRDWLNSSENTNAITWSCGNSPSYSNEAGFLSNFTTTEQKFIKTIEKYSADTNGNFALWSLLNPSDIYNTTYYNAGSYLAYSDDITDVAYDYEKACHEVLDSEQVFLLDVYQLSKVYTNLGDDYYKAKPTSGCVKNDTSSNNVDSTVHYWLRTPETDATKTWDDSLVRIVNNDGQVTEEFANATTVGIRPAFYFDKDKLSGIDEYTKYTITGSGTATDPYILSEGDSHGDTTSRVVNKYFSFTSTNDNKTTTYDHINVRFSQYDNKYESSGVALENAITIDARATIIFGFTDVPNTVKINSVELY